MRWTSTMRKMRVLLISLCSFTLLYQLVLRPSAVEENIPLCFSVCESAPVCTGPTNFSVISDDVVLWTAHSILTSTMDGYHYAIIRSIMHHVQPTVFYLHVSNAAELILPEFSQKLNDEYPNIRVVEYKGAVDVKPAFADIQKMISPFENGVYVSMSVFLQPPMRKLLATEKCVVDVQQLVILFHSDCPYSKSAKPATEDFKDIVSNDPSDEAASAVAVHPSVFSRLTPYAPNNANGADKHWNRVVEKSLEAMPHREPVIPNVVHYVWFSSDATWQMTFMQLISVLSNLKINQVDTVFIYSNVPPTGPHWDWLRQHYGDRIQRRYYPIVEYVFGKKLRDSELAHGTDVARLLVLKRFGGMYFDWNTIALKSHQKLRHYDAVMGSDVPFTDGLASQHVLFRPDSEFLRRYLNNYKDYDAESAGKNAVAAPKQIFLQYPYLMRMPDKFILSPREEETVKIYDVGGVFGMNEYYAFHYISPDPEHHFKLALNFESVNQLKGTFGTILKYIIQHP